MLKISYVSPRILILIKNKVQGALCIVSTVKKFSRRAGHGIALTSHSNSSQELFSFTIIHQSIVPASTIWCYQNIWWGLKAGNFTFLHSCPSIPREFHPPSSRIERGKVAQMSLGLQNKSFKICHQPPAQRHGKMHFSHSIFLKLPTDPHVLEA